jgi:hypothetical protein
LSTQKGMFLPNDVEIGPNSDLTLAVRVMDYDWGKKDDLLGECLVRVSSLLNQAGTALQFDLSLKGSGGKGSVQLTATLQFASTGRFLDLKCVRADGLKSADFFSKNDVYVQCYFVDASTDGSRALPEPDKTKELPAGALTVPFRFQIPEGLPSSFETRVGDYAYIRYSLYSNIDIAWKMDPSCRRRITIFGTDLPQPTAMSPAIRPEAPPQTIYGFDCGCFKCNEQGTAGFSAGVNQQCASPGAYIYAGVKAFNNTSLNATFRVRLVKHVKLSDRYCFGTTAPPPNVTSYSLNTTRGTEVIDIHSEPMPPGGSIEWAGQALKIPLVPPTFLGKPGTTIWHK